MNTETEALRKETEKPIALPSHSEPCSVRFVEWALRMRDIAKAAVVALDRRDARIAELEKDANRYYALRAAATGQDQKMHDLLDSIDPEGMTNGQCDNVIDSAIAARTAGEPSHEG